MADTADSITLSDDGFSVPTVEVLTGRGFVTGKSGSGKSNTVSVVAEELLAAEVPLLIVDTDGEYYGLKEQFELLHVGADDRCDLQVRPAHAEKIAAVALDRQVPVILDVSGYRDQAEGRRLVGEVAESLFVREKTAKTPFLLVVEEAHEFMPEQGGLDEVGETLIRVAKRGRKRGLGICALSQRPASVSKDYITQCDWLVWHRLTWENDTKVVSRILGSDAAADVQDLDDGEAIVMTDWDGAVSRVRFRRKRTFDAGATPGLDSIEPPDLKSVDDDLVADIAAAVENGASDGGTSAETGTGSDETADGSTDRDSADRNDGTPDRNAATADGTEAATDPDAGSSDRNAATAADAGLPSTGGAGSDDAPLAAGGESADGTARSDGPGRGSAAASGRSGGAVAVAGADPASDPAWEAAQFVTYLGRRLVATLGRGVVTAGELARRGLRGVAERTTRSPTARRRVESLLPTAFLLLLLVVALGLVATALLG